MHDFNFSGLSQDHLEKLEKRMNKMSDKFVADYMTAMDVINKKEINRDELLIGMTDLFSDVNKRCLAIYVECTNKVQQLLLHNLLK